MNKLAGILVFCFFAAPAVAQNNVIYFDSNWRAVNHAGASAYKRVLDPVNYENSVYLYEDYLASGEKYSDGVIVNPQDGANYSGIITFYHRDGSKKAKGEMKNGSKKGIWIFWHPNGVVFKKVEYLRAMEDSYYDFNFNLLEYNDKNGTSLLTNGSVFEFEDVYENGVVKAKGAIKNHKKDGKWMGFYPTGELAYVEYYQEGSFQNGISYDKSMQAYEYQQLIAAPQYPGGNESLYRTINENLKYPEEAKKNGLEGKVYVQFTVSPEGYVENVKAIKGVSKELDAEAESVITKCADWIPGRVQGIPAEMKVTLPIFFMLKR